MKLDLRSKDYATPLEGWHKNKVFNDLNREFVHQRFLKMSVAGGEVSDAMMEHVLNQMLNYFYVTASCDEQFVREKAAILKMWPVACRHMKNDAGLAQLMLEHGEWSRYVFPFLWDIWFQPAVAFLPGFGICRSVLDDFEPLPFGDRLAIYTSDCTFGMELHRTKVFQEVAKKSKRLLLPGGGVAPILWAWNYPLGELDQEIVIIDNNPNMPGYLEKLIGRPLKEVNIRYIVGDFLELSEGHELEGYADATLPIGLAAYFDNCPERFYEALARVTAPGGKVGFDYTLMDPTFAFVLKTCHWQTVFKVEENTDAAIKKAHEYAAYGNLQIKDVQAGPIDHPVSVTFLAEKAG